MPFRAPPPTPTLYPALTPCANCQSSTTTHRGHKRLLAGPGPNVVLRGDAGPGGLRGDAALDGQLGPQPDVVGPEGGQAQRVDGAARVLRQGRGVAVGEMTQARQGGSAKEVTAAHTYNYKALVGLVCGVPWPRKWSGAPLPLWRSWRRPPSPACSPCPAAPWCALRGARWRQPPPQTPWQQCATAPGLLTEAATPAQTTPGQLGCRPRPLQCPRYGRP